MVIPAPLATNVPSAPFTITTTRLCFPCVYVPRAYEGRLRYSVAWQDSECGPKQYHRASSNFPPSVMFNDHDELAIAIETFRRADAMNIPRDRLIADGAAAIEIHTYTWKRAAFGHVREGTGLGLISLRLNGRHIESRLNQIFKGK